MLLLKTSRETLLAPLQTVAGIVEKRHTLPIPQFVDRSTFLLVCLDEQFLKNGIAGN